jgi:hypothetical protein
LVFYDDFVLIRHETIVDVNESFVWISDVSSLAQKSARIGYRAYKYPQLDVNQLTPSAMVSHTPTNLSVTASFHKLRALSSLISSSLDDLEKTCAQLDTPWPDLDKAAYTSDCTLDANFEALRSNNVDVSKAVETVVASAFQLIASVREPKSLIIQSSATVSTYHYLVNHHNTLFQPSDV